MGLPKIDQSLFPITIPSTGKKTRFRPFTLKEEKILLIAQESREREQIIVAMSQIIGNCVLDVDAEKLTVFDLEYILLKLRSKSADSKVKVSIKDTETDETINFEIDLEKIEMTFNEAHNKLIKVNDNISLEMRYPTVKTILAGESTNNLQVMIDCIDKVIQGDDVYFMDDFSIEEKTEFSDSLNSTALKGIREFFETMPKLKLDKKYKDKNGNEKTYTFEGFESFFI